MGGLRVSERVQEVVKHGRWLYDGQVPYEVWILKQNYTDDPGASEEEREAGLSKRNGDGFFFYAAYGRNEGRTGISNSFPSQAEAIAQAERTIKGGINWDK